MKYRLFLMMATFVGLGSINTSCSRDNEPVASDGDQKAPISFNVNIGTLPTPTVTTRGYTTNSSESGYTFNGDEYVAVGLTHPSGSEVIKQYLVGAGNSGGNSLTYKKEADGTTTGYTFDWHSTTETGVSIRAWSDGVSTAASTPVVDPDGHTFTVETTQSGNVKELLYSPAASYSYTTSAINIPLYHQLSRIVVTIIRENTSNTISSVTIGHDSDGNRVPITGTFTKPGSTTNYGSWSVASEATQLTHWSVITPKEETTGSVFSAVVIPTTYTADMRLFNITIGTQTFAYKVPTGGKTFEAGKQYNYTITVGNQGITVTSNITDWTDASDGTDFTHGDGLAVLKNVKMNPLWYVAEKNVDYTAANGTKTWDSGAGTFSFATADNTGYFFVKNDALKYFTTAANAVAATPVSISSYYTGTGCVLENWHLPVYNEWNSILPGPGTDVITSDFATSGGSAVYKSSTATCVWGYNEETKADAGIVDKSYWYRVDAGYIYTLYALRFLGTPYCSIWKYEMRNASATATWDATANGRGYLTITSRLLHETSLQDPSNFTTDADATTTCSAYIASNSWASHFTGLTFTNGNDDVNYAVQRIFYALGDTPTNIGTGGMSNAVSQEWGEYDSSTINPDAQNPPRSWLLSFTTKTSVRLWLYDGNHGYGRNIRLFRDN